jgi:hypothetical protein
VLDRRASDGVLKVLDEPLHEVEIRPIVEWLVNLDDGNVIVELFRRSTDEEKYSHNVRDCMKEELFRSQLQTGRRMLVTAECEAPSPNLSCESSKVDARTRLFRASPVKSSAMPRAVPKRH